MHPYTLHTEQLIALRKQINGHSIRRMALICNNKLDIKSSITEHQTIPDAIETGTAVFTFLKHFDISSDAIR